MSRSAQDHGQHTGSLSSRWWRRSARLLRAAVVAYLLVVVLFMWFENLLIYPTRQIPAGDWQPDGLVHQDVWFQAADGTRLHGWYFEHANPQAYVLYCHGNGENVAHLAQYADTLRDRYDIAVFAWDYRGYGQSQGHPEEPGIIADARAAQQWLAERAGLTPQDLVLWGRSIGGGVVVQLAAERGARGLVLERTFTSLPDVAASHFPWLPVRTLMRNRYDSLAVIGEYRGPLVQSHGTADEVVPFELGKQLFQAATARPKEFISMRGVSHNGPSTQEFYTGVREMLEKLPPRGRQP